MRTCSLVTLGLLVATSASAADPAKANAPEFLLGDLNVRVDLPKGSWRMTRWSDWDFAGESNDGVLLFVWATPLEVPIAGDPNAWGAVYTAKIEEMKATEPKISSAKIEDVGGRKAAFLDAGFEFGNTGKRGAAAGATLEIVGQNVHLMTVGPAASARAVERARTELARRLEFPGGPPPSTYGTEVSITGAKTTLPADWRPPLDSEWNAVVAAHADTLQKLGVEDVTGCWTAIRTKPMAAPDLMVSCNRNVRLGVVDEHSWESGEATARERLFGKSLPPGQRLDLADRIGFVYAPRDGLAMGVVPHEPGVAVVWAMGDGDLGASVRDAMKGSTFAGAHPVETGEVVSYWLTERTFSPQVLCPALCCLGAGVVVVAAVGLVALRPRKRSDEDDE